MKLLLVVGLLSTAICGQWIKQTVNTTASFRGLAVVSEKVVWASGTGGTVIRTVDGGKAWDVITVPGAEKLDFRDIEEAGRRDEEGAAVEDDESLNHDRF